MGLLELKRFMSMQQERRRSQIQVRNGWIDSANRRKGSHCERDCVADGTIASRNKRKCSPFQRDCVADGTIASRNKRKCSPFQRDCVADGTIASRNKRKGSPFQRDCVADGTIASRDSPCQLDDGSVKLPEDIWRHIHSLMPMRDAAKAACVSRTFLCSWRCHPNLTFSKETLGLKGNVVGCDETARECRSKVDQILNKHSGVGVKTLKLLGARDYNSKDRSYLDSWLQMAVTPGIEEVTFILCSKNKKYNFPCSLLSNGNGDSIRSLHLSSCAFGPTVGFGCLRSLTRLNLFTVRITEDELGCLLSHSPALERLALRYCSGIGHLKIPCLLKRLSHLEVFTSSKRQVIESKAPNLFSFSFDGGFKVQQLSLGEASSQVKNLYMGCSGAVSYIRTELASSMPNLETLAISSTNEMVNTPMASSKFFCLKYLSITLTTFSPNYDYFSLVSFIDASPSMQTLVLDVRQRSMEHVSVLGDSTRLRQMPEHKHDNLRVVKISGFSSAKSLIELTCHILGSATSLNQVVLDTKVGHGAPGCSVNKTGKCLRMERDHIMEAHKALLAARTYIRPKVPPTVNLNVLAPCSRCHVY